MTGKNAGPKSTAPAQVMLTALAVGLVIMAGQAAGKQFLPAVGHAPGKNSFPIPVFTYDTTFELKADPRTVLDAFARDISWIEKTSSSLHIEVLGQRPGMDLTEVGQVMQFNVRLLGVQFPCQYTALKYVPDRELLSIIYTRGSWLLFRYKFEPVAEGTRARIRIVAYPSASLRRIIEVVPLVRAVAAKVDQAAAYFEARFNPGAPSRRPGKGLRGELSRAFLQGYVASIDMDVPPDRVMTWIEEGGRLRGIFPNLKFGGGCGKDKKLLWSRPGDLISCPATYQAGDFPLESTTMSSGGWEQRAGKTWSHHVWIVARDTLICTRIEVRKKRAGSRLTLFFAFEMPEQDAPWALDLLYSISGVPDRARDVLQEVKQAVKFDGIGEIPP